MGEELLRAAREGNINEIKKFVETDGENINCKNIPIELS